MNRPERFALGKDDVLDVTDIGKKIIVDVYSNARTKGRAAVSQHSHAGILESFEERRGVIENRPPDSAMHLGLFDRYEVSLTISGQKIHIFETDFAAVYIHERETA